MLYGTSELLEYCMVRVVGTLRSTENSSRIGDTPISIRLHSPTAYVVIIPVTRVTAVMAKNDKRREYFIV
jgi:hypothetical protein